MTVAIRPVVQRSVSKSQAVAPRRRRRGSCRCCAAVNFGGRPGAGFAVKALRPRRRTTSRQMITELCEHPSRRATSVTDAPAFSSSIPRRRRRSSSSGLPCGRMPRAYRVKHQMSITYAHINNVHAQERCRLTVPGVLHGLELMQGLIEEAPQVGLVADDLVDIEWMRQQPGAELL